MCTCFKDTSGLSTSHLLLNLNKKRNRQTKQRGTIRQYENCQQSQ
jgi:hypothetical protein